MFIKYSSENSLINCDINNRDIEEAQSLNLSSLADIYDSISLYDYEEENSRNLKKITWEEWYLNKKILSLKREKRINKKKQEQQNKIQETTRTDEKNKKLLEWLDKKKKHKENQKLEEQNKIIQIEKKVNFFNNYKQKRIIPSKIFIILRTVKIIIRKRKLKKNTKTG